MSSPATTQPPKAPEAPAPVKRSLASRVMTRPEIGAAAAAIAIFIFFFAIAPPFRTLPSFSTVLYASSTIGIPARSAAAAIGSRSALRPNRWTGITAFVRGVIAFAAAAGSMLNVAGSTSTRTGRAPRREIDPAVAKNE